jgi:hypothetical protein
MREALAIVRVQVHSGVEGKALEQAVAADSRTAANARRA